jgi:hypothetical protein
VRATLQLGAATRAAGLAGDPSSESYLVVRSREIVQHWWKANAAAVKEGRWKDVLPGELYFTADFNAHMARLEKLTPPEKWNKLFQGVATPSPESPAQDIPPPAQPAPAPLASNEPTQNRFLLYVASGATALFVAIALFLRAARKRRAKA